MLEELTLCQCLSVSLPWFEEGLGVLYILIDFLQTLVGRLLHELAHVGLCITVPGLRGEVS